MPLEIGKGSNIIQEIIENMISHESEMICGNCGNFDTYKVTGVPVGQITLSTGEKVNEGLCRTLLGLVEVGVIHEKSPCRRRPPEEFFRPREQAPAAV